MPVQGDNVDLQVACGRQAMYMRRHKPDYDQQATQQPIVKESQRKHDGDNIHAFIPSTRVKHTFCPLGLCHAVGIELQANPGRKFPLLTASSSALCHSASPIIRSISSWLNLPFSFVMVSVCCFPASATCLSAG